MQAVVLPKVQIKPSRYTTFFLLIFLPNPLLSRDLPLYHAGSTYCFFKVRFIMVKQRSSFFIVPLY